MKTQTSKIKYLEIEIQKMTKKRSNYQKDEVTSKSRIEYRGGALGFSLIKI